LESQNERFTEKLKNMALIRRNILKLLPVLLLTFTATACKITFGRFLTVEYSSSGASISPQIKTLSVQRFFNRASLVQPGLDQYITDALIDKCRSQTNLQVVRDLGDVDFEGEITDYRTQPLTVGADSYASMNRFTITVRVKFTNTVEPHLSYEQSFSAYEDYDGSKDLSAVEQDLSVKIFEKIVEDIFNRAFVNW